MSSDNGDIQVFSAVVEALKKLERADQIRLLQTVQQFLGLEVTSSTLGGSSPAASVEHRSEPIDQGPYSADRAAPPKKFLAEKQPKTDTQRVACLAYYLTHFRDMPHFKTLDISKLNTEAAQPKFSNAHYSVNNATSSGYLAPGPKGTKQISAAGEHFVQLLPDSEAARAAMNSMLRRRSQKTKSKKLLLT